MRENLPVFSGDLFGLRIIKDVNLDRLNLPTALDMIQRRNERLSGYIKTIGQCYLTQRLEDNQLVLQSGMRMDYLIRKRGGAYESRNRIRI